MNLKHIINALLMLLVVAGSSGAQGLSAKWEELTAPDFVQALQASKGTCALPFGIIEKHGPSGPLGTDLLNVRYTTGLAAAGIASADAPVPMTEYTT